VIFVDRNIQVSSPEHNHLPFRNHSAIRTVLPHNKRCPKLQTGSAYPPRLSQDMCTTSISDLSSVIAHYDIITPSHNNLLSVSMLLTGFFALMCLGEMTFPDDKKIQDWRKISQWHTVISTAENYSFDLPFHKADRFFSGNTILVKRSESPINPVQHFQLYLSS